MPRSGWCRECGEWVWVDEGDACQYGHGPECVEHVHEQSGEEETPQEVAASEQQEPIVDGIRAETSQQVPDWPFGVGDMPSDLRRFNWGAFFLPLFWGLTYGSWPIVSVWLAALLSPALLGLMTGSGDVAPAGTAIAVTVISEMIAGASRLWAGLNANSLVWRREALRLEVVPGAKARFKVDKFAGRQRVWLVWGAVIMVVGTLATIPLGMTLWADYELTYIGAIMPVVWLLAEVAAAFWLDMRARTSPPAAENAPGNGWE